MNPTKIIVLYKITFFFPQITVKAITERAGKPEEGFALAETKQSVPDVAPVSSAIKNYVKVDRVQ